MSSSKKILAKQKLFLAAATTGSILLFSGLYFMLSDGVAPAPAQVHRKIDLPVDKVDAREYWASQVDQERGSMQKKIQYLEDLVLQANRSDQEGRLEREQLHREMYQMREELKNRSQVTVETPACSFDIEPEQFIAPPKLIVHSMEEREVEKVRNVERVIPAGTTVKALLVSSVDASCSVGASSEPQPVKLRILDDGHLPKKVRALLKGGILIASAYGDISSERVYIRAERLTQVRASGDFVETTVAGFVTGEDGKYGVRGVIADRSGKLVKSAAVSGFLGGIGKFLQATVNAQDIRDATRGQPNTFSYDLLKEGSSSGASSAMDRLSDYYIQRAEQILPVIQVAAGRVVDVTFTIGTDIGDLNTKERVKQLREGAKAEGEFL